jgi:ATP-binding cassette, subfamily B, bacterial PglK
MILVLLLGFFEVIGIASVLPFMELLSKPNAIAESRWLAYIYDAFDFQSYRSFVIASGSFIIATIAFSNLLGIYSQFYHLRFSWNLAHRMSTGLLRVYADKPYSYYLKKNTSDLRAYLLNEVVALTSGVLIPIIEFVSRSIICLIILTLLMMVSVKATFVMALFLGGSYGVIYIARQGALKKLGKEKIESNTLRFRYLEEMLTGIKTVKTYAAQRFFYDRFEKQSKRFSLIQPKVQMTYAAPKYILEIVAMGGVLAFTMYLFVNSGNLLNSLPKLTLYAIAGYRLLPALQNAFSAIAKVKHSMPSLHKLYDDLILAKDIDQLVVSKIKPMPLNEQIELESINFQYDEDGPAILKHLSLQIKKGEIIAFVGATGSGKTTLIDILTGLLTPTKGKIIVDGVVVTEGNIEQWQKNIAYVPQDVYLYDDTIKANVTFGNGNEEFDQVRMQEALRMAGIDVFINQELPEGIMTKIGERGVRLSGGQRQRLGLARALYTNPGVLVLDEATSALDSITEKGIIESLLSLPDDLTIIMIAHRLSTVQYADKIFLLEKGEIIGSGSYGELIESSEIFKEMDDVSWKKNTDSVVNM